MAEATTVKNPLEIPEDLKSSRLVKKCWNDEALSAMKKLPNSTVNVHSSKALAALMTCLGGTSNFPCSKFKLNFELIRYYDHNKKRWSYHRAAEVLFSDFLLKISSWVTELTWETFPREHDEIFVTVFPRKVEFPNLKVLRLKYFGSDLATSFWNFQLLLTNILKKAPSLKKLSLESPWRKFHTLVNLLVKTKISFFTELELTGYINNNDLERLSTWDRALKLKSVNLTFSWTETLNARSLFQFLSSQNASLEELKLDFSNISQINKKVTFPPMPNLKTLSIEVPTKGVMSFKKISYTRQFPALKTLHLNDQSINYIHLNLFDLNHNCLDAKVFKELLKPRMDPVCTVEELTLPPRLSSVSDVPMLMSALEAGTFPNVKKLGVEADPDLLRSVFNKLPDLEELTLDYSRLRGFIDSMLTGLAEWEIAAMKRGIAREGNAFQWDKWETGHVSIASLQKLRVLRFKTDVWCKYLRVSQVALHLIFSRMGSLRCIEFDDKSYPLEKEITAWRDELNKDCVLLFQAPMNYVSDSD